MMLLLALSASVLALLSCAPSSTHAKVPRSFWGVSLTDSKQLNGTDFDRMKSGRVAEVHWTLFWPSIEPIQTTPDNFDWSESDALVGNLASRGIRLMPDVYGSPSFAAKTQQTPPLGSANARSQWKDFLRELIDRYGPGGTYWATMYHVQHPGGSPVPIKAWQVWNEPNLPHYFHTKHRVKKYATLLRISHQAVKSADPKAKVVLAGMPGYTPVRGPNFLDQLYKQNVKRYFDAAAVHPYAPSVRFQARTLKRMRQVMNKHGDRRTPLWITELSWGSGPPDKYGVNKGLKGQKRALTKSYKMVLKHRRRWNLGRLFWFQWIDLPPSTPPSYCNSSVCKTAGLFRYDQTPKPSWQAFRHFTVP